MIEYIASPLTPTDASSLLTSPSTGGLGTSVPADVLEFAENNNLMRYLPDVVELMSRISGGQAVVVRLAWDPEIPDDGSIVFESNAAGQPEDRWLSAYREWQPGVSQICAHNDTRFFTFMMV